MTRLDDKRPDLKVQMSAVRCSSDKTGRLVDVEVLDEPIDYEYGERVFRDARPLEDPPEESMARSPFDL